MVDNTVYVNKRNIENSLQTDVLNKNTPRIASIIEIREIINKIIRKLSIGLDIIVEGRDITTVIFPDADLKIFLDASIDERVNRYLQKYGADKNVYKIKSSIIERDKFDFSLENGFRKMGNGVQYIDTTNIKSDDLSSYMG